MKPSATIIITALIIALTATPAVARTYHYSVTDGLANNSITSIAIDADGLAWIATEEGLSRFDGKHFRNFTRENSGLTANELNCVTIDPADSRNVWIGTQRDGVCFYDHSTGQIAKAGTEFLRSDDITDIVPARDGQGLWFVNYHFGVQYYNPSTGEHRTFNHENIDSLPRLCWTVAESRDGLLYVGHDNGGMSVIDPTSMTATTYTATATGLPGNNVYAIDIDNNGCVWTGTDRGAALFNPDSGSFTPFIHVHGSSHSIEAGRVRDIHILSGGEILFATSQGGLSALPVRAYAYSDISNASFSTTVIHNNIDTYEYPAGIRCICEDPYGNVWIGNAWCGIDVICGLSPGIERLPYPGEDSPENIYRSVWSCTTSPDGRVWLGSNNGIARYDGAEGQVIPLPVMPRCIRSRVTAMAATPDGLLWIGTDDRGAMTYNTSSGLFTQIPMEPVDIRSFTPHPDGSMLVATVHGLYKVTGTGATPVDSINNVIKDRLIQDVAVDRDRRMWIATFGKGLYVFDRNMNMLAWHDVVHGFPSNAISHLFIDSSQRLWVATRAGLILFNNTSDFNDYINVAPEIIGKAGHIKSVSEDKEHFILSATSRGIVRINPKDLSTAFYSSNALLPLNSFIDRAVTADPDGNLYLASTNGLFRFDTSAIRNISSKMQQARVMSISLDGNREIAVSRNIQLSHHDNAFIINFNVPDHAMREHMEYSYRLVGADDDWVDADDSNHASYRNIQPGHYRFILRQRVKGTDWEQPVEMLSVSINPPLWLTWWAKALYIMIARTLVLAASYYYSRRINLRQRLKAQIKSNREREKLNEERLRFYTNITHELRTPLTLIMGPIEDMAGDPSLPDRYRAKLRVIHDSSTRLLQLINGILEFRKTETQNRHLVVCHGNPGNLVREMALRYKELNRNPEVSVSLDIDDNLPDIYYDREILMAVVNNLLSNAMKYTPSGRIDVTCRHVTDRDRRYIQVSVADTGYGIAPEAVPHIFERYYQAGGRHQAEGSGIGLALVKSLVDLHRGSIKVDSVRGKGSTFTLRLPVDETYPDAEHAASDSLPDTHAAVTREQHDPQPDPGRSTILVVEDNDDIRDYIAQVLADRFTVITARNGYEGLQIINEQMPSMVVSDIMMPELDGIEMCRAIKENMLTSHIPVILLTARDTLSDKQQGYESGADSYLTKPFTANLLLSRIDNIRKQRIDLANKLLATPPQLYPELREDSPAGIGPQTAETDPRASLGRLDREFIDKIDNIIDTNISREDLGVVFIAENMFMSQSTLYRKIMAIMGISTNEYIRHRRLLRAVELLSDGSMTVTEIAFATGFGNHSSFGKAFKKAYGCTPTEFKTKDKK